MKSATDRSSPPPAGRALDGLSPEAIAIVTDSTARKTLEQARAFAGGLADALHSAPGGDTQSSLALALTSTGIGLADAEQIAAEGVALIALVTERDRCADAFHAAVRAAADGERALYDRLSSFARLLRMTLGPSSPALASFGVPSAEGFELSAPRARYARPGALDTNAPK